MSANSIHRVTNNKKSCDENITNSLSTMHREQISKAKESLEDPPREDSLSIKALTIHKQTNPTNQSFDLGSKNSKSKESEDKAKATLD